MLTFEPKTCNEFEKLIEAQKERVNIYQWMFIEMFVPLQAREFSTTEKNL